MHTEEELLNLVVHVAITASLFANYLVFFGVAMWKIFRKAGYQGWEFFVPFYGQYCLTKMIFGKGWMWVFLFIPGINTFLLMIWFYHLARVFGKEVGFSIATAFFWPVMILIIAFGESEFITNKNHFDFVVESGRFIEEFRR